MLWRYLNTQAEPTHFEMKKCLHFFVSGHKLKEVLKIPASTNKAKTGTTNYDVLAFPFYVMHAFIDRNWVKVKKYHFKNVSSFFVPRNENYFKEVHLPVLCFRLFESRLNIYARHRTGFQKISFCWFNFFPPR